MKFAYTIFFILILSLFSSLAKSQDKNISQDKYLIVLDTQEYYTKGKLSDISTKSVINSINYVIDIMDSINVIYMKRIHKVLNISLSYPFIYTSLDTTAMRFDKRLNLVNEQIFTREKSNAFANKELIDFLKHKNVREIIVIGFLAEEFLYQSAIKGKELGYNMYVIPEAIIDKSQKGKEKIMKKLTKEGIRILHI